MRGGSRVRPGHDGDPRLLYGGADREPLLCDGGPRGLLDLDAMRRHAVDRTRAEWVAEQRDFRRLVADHPPARPLTDFLARHAADPAGYPHDRAVAEHHAQPLVRALNHRSVWQRYPSLGIWVLGPTADPITQYTRDPGPDLARAATWAVTTYALLTTEGEWFDAGQSDPDAYARQSTEYLEALPADCLVVGLLCHT